MYPKGSIYGYRAENAHELQLKYGHLSRNEAAKQIIQDQGLPPNFVTVYTNGVVPDWVSPKAFPKGAFTSGNKNEINAGTAFSDVHYLDKAGGPTPVTIVSNPVQADSEFYSTLLHELNHVKDHYNGTEVSDEQAGNAFENEKKHFGSDIVGQEVDFGGRNALGMMENRLSGINSNNIPGTASPQNDTHEQTGQMPAPVNFEDTSPADISVSNHLADGGSPESTMSGGSPESTPSFEDTQPIDQSVPIAEQATSIAPKFEDTQPVSSAPPSFDETIPENPVEQGKAFLEGLGKGLIPFGGTTYLEKAILNNAPEQLARENAYPGTEFAGQVTGLVGPAIATLGTSVAARLGLPFAAKALSSVKAASAFTQAGILEKIAHSGSALAGLGGEGAGIVSKIGSAVVKGAIENSLFQAGDEISKQILDPKNASEAVTSALYDIGGAALFGGTVGGAFGTAGALWKANVMPRVGGVLKAISDKVGGVANPSPSPIHDIFARIGVEVPPEIMASFSNDPEIQQLASVLNQSDTTKSGLEYQDAIKNFKIKLNEKVVQFLDLDPNLVQKEFSKAEAGSQAGHTLSSEYQAKVGPISDAFDAARDKYADAELGPSIAEKQIESDRITRELQKDFDSSHEAQYKALANGDFEKAAEHQANIQDIKSKLAEVEMSKAVPGVKDMLSQDIAALVHNQSWAGSEDIMKEVNRLTDRIPMLNTIEDLQREMTAVGNNTASKLPFGMNDPLSRAGGLLKSALREAEMTAVGTKIGSEEGVDALNAFNTNRKNFSEVAKLKDALDDRLRIGGSVSGYAKGIKGMAGSESEQVWKRLSGERSGGDSEILNILKKEFPQTAQVIKQSHINELISDAAKTAKPDYKINLTNLVKSIKNLTPELRNFVIPSDTQQYMGMVEDLTHKIQDGSYNFSNTARTVDKLLQHAPGTALGLVTMLLSHNPLTSLIVGGLVKPLSKDAPDAIRLSMLKFLGSPHPIEPSAFKSAMEFIHSAYKGHNAAINAVDSIFKGATKAGSAYVIPQVTPEMRKKLDDKVKESRETPGKLFHSGDKTSYYMPDHGSAVAQTAATVSNYLNGIRPEPSPSGPLDEPMAPSANAQASYDRALDVGQNPLSILSHIKNGTLLFQDVANLKSMYPTAHQSLSQKLMDSLTDHIAEGGSIPYGMRQSLSMFLGQPLDASLTQPAMQSIILSSNAISQNQEKQKKASGVELKQINKSNSNIATSLQARQMDRRS